MTKGEDWKKKRFKTDRFAVLEISPFVATAIKFMQKCVCFTNPCFNLLVLPSVIRVWATTQGMDASS